MDSHIFKKSQNNEHRMANFDVFPVKNCLNRSEFSPLATSALAVYHLVFCSRWGQNIAFCERVHFARNLVLQASTGNPDIAESKPFIGDYLISPERKHE